MEIYNVAHTLPETAARMPFGRALVFPAGRDRKGRARYTQLSFEQLNTLCDRYAHGLAEYGFHQGERVLMMVRPGIELTVITFALLKIGAVPVFIDPGMKRRDFLQCVRDTRPTAFIGIPLAHALRTIYRRPFGSIERAVTVGRRWFWGGRTLDEVTSERRDPFPLAPTTPESEAAITFTSGSTGPPKGVVYVHGIFRAQIALLRDELGVAEGEVDLPGLYIFALFNPALGVTTIFPDMDPTRPAQVDPAVLVEAIRTHGVTNSFGSPVIWKRVARYCLEHEIRLPSLRRIVMAGAPVPPSLIDDFSRILDGGDVFTPFGATEALPLTMMTGREILAETAELSERGGGMCVGRPTPGTDLRVIRILDEPIPEWRDDLVLPAGEVGEIVAKGPVVTRVYVNRPDETAHAKIIDADGVWHRMGDVGYFDEQGRLWFCGRKSHRVETAAGRVFPVPCEAIFNRHPDVARTAVVGVGELGEQTPVLVVEPREGAWPASAAQRERFVKELLALGAEHEKTRSIREVLFHRSFPVDVRHNAKIRREVLAEWAEGELGGRR